MKFKDTSSNGYLENIKCNPNIELTAQSIKKVEPEDLKKNNAVLTLYNIINYLFPYNILEEEKDEKEILSNIINTIEKEINKEETINSKEEINNLIIFNKSAYLVIDAVEYKGMKYLFMINNEYYDNDTAIVKKIDDKYECVKDEDEFKNIVYKLILNFKEKILELV